MAGIKADGRSEGLPDKEGVESLRIPYEKVPVEDHGWKIANINSEEDYSLLTGAKINISLEEALKILEQHITRITDTQMTGLIEAVGRRTAQDLYSPSISRLLQDLLWMDMRCGERTLKARRLRIRQN